MSRLNIKNIKWLFLLMVLFSIKSFAREEIIGRWLYVGFIYEGQQFQPLDPNLTLYFDFSEDKTSILQWSWSNTSEVCSRMAIYAYDHQQIDQWVVWLNPNNAGKCSSDPDMRLGSRSQTNYFIKNENLYLELSLDNKPLYYVLKKVSNL